MAQGLENPGLDNCSYNQRYLNFLLTFAEILLNRTCFLGGFFDKQTKKNNTLLPHQGVIFVPTSVSQE